MASALQRIESDFKFETAENGFVSDFILKKSMMKVCRSYQRVCQVVKLLHHHFKWIFMSHVTYILIDMTALIFRMMKNNMSMKEDYILIVWVLDPIIRLWLITSVSDCIQEKVRL